MSRSNFTGPLSFGEQTGISTTDTRAFIPGSQVKNLSQASPSVTFQIPPKAVVTKVGFVPTSAFTGTDPVSAMNITFANGTIVHAIVPVSANTRYAESTFVSGAVYDDGGTLTATLSAQSTTVFTGGGGRAYVGYIVVE